MYRFGYFNDGIGGEAGRDSAKKVEIRFGKEIAGGVLWWFCQINEGEDE